MPDYWSVPIVPGVLTDLNQQIAKGPDLSFLNNIADNYFKGKDQRYIQDQRDVFKGGIPRVDPNDPNSAIDYSKLAQSLATVQGTAAAPTIVEMAKLQNAQEVNKNAFGPSPVATNPNTQPVSAAVPPSPSPAIPNRQPSQAQPVNGYRGGDTSTSVISILGANGVPDEQVGKLAIEVAGKLGVDPNEPLNMSDPNVRAALTEAVRTYKTASAAPAGPMPPSSIPQSQPIMPGAPPAAPPNVAAPQPTAPQPAGPSFAQRFAPAGPVPPQSAPVAPPPGGPGLPSSGDPTLGGLIPPNFVAKFGADAPGKFINYLTSQMGAVPKETADAYKSRIEAVQKAMSAANEPTPAMKDYQNAVRSGYRGTPQEYLAQVEQDKAFSTKTGTNYATRYENLQESGVKATTTIPQLQLAKQLTLDPNFSPGFAADKIQMAKLIIGRLGGDPNAAAPLQEAGGLINSTILSGLKAIVQGTGQIRSAELKLMQSAAASEFDSPQAYRFKVEVALRAQQRASDLAELAQNYNGGKLDAGFDKVARAWMAEHPMFTPEEIKNPKLIGAVPGQNAEAAPKTWTGPSGKTYKVINNQLSPM